MTHGLAPKPRPRRSNARKYLTVDAERIIAACYPGQVLAAVIERAIRQMAARDGLLTPRTGKVRARSEAGPRPR
ncbi:MAG: hypothetical protein HOY79_01955 [Streptomyces sp.]|nr:hypothetical protein [Streptomyces sp.]